MGSVHSHTSGVTSFLFLFPNKPFFLVYFPETYFFQSKQLTDKGQATECFKGGKPSVRESKLESSLSSVIH